MIKEEKAAIERSNEENVKRNIEKKKKQVH